MDWLLGRSRKKEKDPLPLVTAAAGAAAATASDEAQCRLPYLEPLAVAECVADLQLLEKLVPLPFGVLREEWMAWHTVAFAEHVSLLYGIVATEWCTSESCPSMSGPSNTQYVWMDERGKKTKCPAPQYVDYVMSYIHKTISDVNVFPIKHGIQFPSSFIPILKKIHRFLFHVVAHLFCAHYAQLQLVGLNAHLNTLFAHLTLFNGHFNLIEEKEVGVLAALWQALLRCSATKPRQSSLVAADGYAESAAASSDESNKENIQLASRAAVRPAQNQ